MLADASSAPELSATLYVRAAQKHVFSSTAKCCLAKVL